MTRKPFWEIKVGWETGELDAGGRFETTPRYWARLKAANGKTIYVSETYPEKRLARKAIAVIEKAYQREPGFVEIRDLAGKP
jgi:uncharacterized protein YegP (UPF0339 family)